MPANDPKITRREFFPILAGCLFSASCNRNQIGPDSPLTREQFDSLQDRAKQQGLNILDQKFIPDRSVVIIFAEDHLYGKETVESLLRYRSGLPPTFVGVEAFDGSLNAKGYNFVTAQVIKTLLDPTEAAPIVKGIESQPVSQLKEDLIKTGFGHLVNLEEQIGSVNFVGMEDCSSPLVLKARLFHEIAGTIEALKNNPNVKSLGLAALADLKKVPLSKEVLMLLRTSAALVELDQSFPDLSKLGLQLDPSKSYYCLSYKAICEYHERINSYNVRSLIPGRNVTMAERIATEFQKRGSYLGFQITGMTHAMRVAPFTEERTFSLMDALEKQQVGYILFDGVGIDATWWNARKYSSYKSMIK